MTKSVFIFGSTGSIGQSTIDIIKNHPEKFKVKVLVAKNNADLLAIQANKLRPKVVVIDDESCYQNLKRQLKYKAEVLCGTKSIEDVAKTKCDLFVSAIVGFAGTIPTLNAIKAHSNVALANKESIVCAGKFLMEEAKKNETNIIPIDSEHNAIFQIFENKNLESIDSITLTASGGPFFNSKKNLAKISVKEALKHPNWKMGAKISIDSATMMNKGLEMIEASHLFPIKKEKIKILVHPESIIHGMVSYSDGSVLAVMSLPDMKTPISYALSYPKRIVIKHNLLDLARLRSLNFFNANEKKFPAINLCRNAMMTDGSAPTVLNGANEIAVEKFLQGKISFTEIAKIVAKTLDKIPFFDVKTIEDVIEYDRLARQVAEGFARF
jgi:1-deoxy-D-xylulose-5-phosphate reductoisomerase